MHVFTVSREEKIWTDMLRDSGQAAIWHSVLVTHCNIDQSCLVLPAPGGPRCWGGWGAAVLGPPGQGIGSPT